MASADIPPVVAPPFDPKANAEAAHDFGPANASLDLRVRAWTSWGIMALVVLMYGSGLYVVHRIIHPDVLKITVPVSAAGAASAAVAQHAASQAQVAAAENGPLVAAITALFSVPTVLLIALLRSVSKGARDTGSESVAQFLGEKVVGAIEKIVQR